MTEQSSTADAARAAAMTRRAQQLQATNVGQAATTGNVAIDTFLKHQAEQQARLANVQRQFTPEQFTYWVIGIASMVNDETDAKAVLKSILGQASQTRLARGGCGCGG